MVMMRAARTVSATIRDPTPNAADAEIAEAEDAGEDADLGQAETVAPIEIVGHPGIVELHSRTTATAQQRPHVGPGGAVARRGAAPRRGSASRMYAAWRLPPCLPPCVEDHQQQRPAMPMRLAPGRATGRRTVHEQAVSRATALPIIDAVPDAANTAREQEPLQTKLFPQPTRPAAPVPSQNRKKLNGAASSATACNALAIDHQHHREGQPEARARRSMTSPSELAEDHAPSGRTTTMMP